MSQLLKELEEEEKLKKESKAKTFQRQKMLMGYKIHGHGRAKEELPLHLVQRRNSLSQSQSEDNEYEEEQLNEEDSSALKSYSVDDSQSDVTEASEQNISKATSLEQGEKKKKKKKTKSVPPEKGKEEEKKMANQGDNVVLIPNDVKVEDLQRIAEQEKKRRNSRTFVPAGENSSLGKTI